MCNSSADSCFGIVSFLMRGLPHVATVSDTAHVVVPPENFLSQNLGTIEAIPLR